MPKFKNCRLNDGTKIEIIYIIIHTRSTTHTHILPNLGNTFFFAVIKNICIVYIVEQKRNTFLCVTTRGMKWSLRTPVLSAIFRCTRTAYLLRKCTVSSIITNDDSCSHLDLPQPDGLRMIRECFLHGLLTDQGEKQSR